MLKNEFYYEKLNKVGKKLVKNIPGQGGGRGGDDPPLKKFFSSTPAVN